MRTRFVHGDYNFICDQCGNKRKASTGRWEYIAGNRTFFTCPECWDRDHPANTPPRFRKNEGGPVPIARPDQTEAFPDTILSESEGGGIILLDNDTGAILLE